MKRKNRTHRTFRKMVGALVVLGAAAAIVAAVAGQTFNGPVNNDPGDPWADYVVSANQGPAMVRVGNQWNFNGSVASTRSNPQVALGNPGAPFPGDGNALLQPEAPEGSFYSLGFGGELVLGFDNLICNGDGNDLRIYETTYGPRTPTYPAERVKVFVSQDGNTFFPTTPHVIAFSGSVGLPSHMLWAQYVKLVDASNPNDFLHITGHPHDGYDLSAVRAEHSAADGCLFDVDIVHKPGSDPKSLNRNSNGVTAVAVLSTPAFDATQIDPASVEFAGAPIAGRGNGNNLMYSFEDVDGDGLPDFLAHFNVQDLDLGSYSPGDTVMAMLTGQTLDGNVHVQGTDSIRIVR